MKRTVVAFTLAEILICVAIIAVLVAIGGAVYRQAINSGGRADEISQLHQIGLATNLYKEANDGWPTNTTTLVEAGLITKAICLSPRDKYKDGWSNEYLTAQGKEQPHYRNAVAPFPNSYLCINDIQSYRREELEPLIAEQPNFGFFVSLTESTSRWHNDNPAGPFEGFYRRVLLDGSVQRKAHHGFQARDAHGNTIKFNSDHAWFFDPTQKWVGELAYTLSP